MTLMREYPLIEFRGTVKVKLDIETGGVPDHEPIDSEVSKIAS